MKDRGWPQPVRFVLGYTLIAALVSIFIAWKHLSPDLLNATVLLIGLAAFRYRRPVYLGLLAVLITQYLLLNLYLNTNLITAIQTVAIVLLTVATMCEIVHSMVEDQRKIERELQDSQRRLEKILNTVQAGILMVDTQTRQIIEANRAALDMIGAPREEVIGKRCHQFVCPAEEANCPICDLGQSVDNSERVLLRINGERIPVLKTVLPIQLDGHAVLVESFVSIAERKRAEEKLQENEQRLRQITDNMSDLVALIDQNSRYLYASPSFVPVLGYIPEELPGKSILWGIHPEDKRLVLESIRSAALARSSGLVEFRCRHADGQYIWLEAKGKPIFSPDGRLLGSVLNARDITERKQAEARLNESESKYHSLFNSIRDPIFVIDRASQKIVDANPAAVDRYGFALEELQTMQPDQLVLPEDRDRLREEQGQPENQPVRRYTHLTRDGKRLLVEISSEELEYSGRKVWFNIVRDVTDQERRERINAAIYEISQAALTVENLEELYRSVHQILGRLIHAENFFFALYDPETGMLTFPYFVDQYDPPPAPFRVERGLTEYVLRTGKPLLATPQVFDELVERGEAISVGTPSLDWVGIPLIVGLRTIGVVVVQSYSEEIRFDQDAVDILGFVSAQVAMAIERKQSEARLREAEASYRQLVEQVNAVMYTDNADELSSFQYVAPQIEQITGYSSEEWVSKPELWLETIHPDDQERVNAENLRTNQTGDPFAVEYRMITRDGRVIWIDDQAVLIRDEFGQPRCWQGVLQDITRRKEAEEKLRQSEAALAEAQALAHLGSFQFGEHFNNPLWSNETYRIVGLNPGQDHLTFDGFCGLIHPEDRDGILQSINLAVHDHQPFDLEFRLLLADETLKFVHSIARPGADHGYIGMLLDVTDRKYAEQKLWLLSTHDALTGLFNRAYFESEMERHQPDQNFPVSIIMADVDGLKITNDTRGHAAGDELLCQAAEILKTAFRKQDVVARIGGDEFAILLPGMNAQSAQEGLDRLRKTLADRVESGQPYPLGLSLGGATGEAGTPTSEVLKQADELMYLDKLHRRGARVDG